MSGKITDENQSPTTGISWWWFFIFIWVILIAYNLFWKRKAEHHGFSSIFFDRIIGITGAFTLGCFSVMMIALSVIHFQKNENTSLLSKFYGSWLVQNLSGVTLSPKYEKIDWLYFERKTDTLRVLSENKGVQILIGTGLSQKNSSKYTLIGGKIVSENNNNIFIDEKTYSGKIVEKTDKIIVASNSGGIIFITPKKEFAYTGRIYPVVNTILSWDEDTIAWIEKTGSGYQPYKNGIPLWKSLKKVEHLGISNNGYDTVILWDDESGTLSIYKNGIKEKSIKEWYIPWTFGTNGTHWIYGINQNGIKHIVYDDTILPGELSEIREIFLENGGSSYAFFGRPLWEERYCIFTKYRWNICGFDGYMNPWLWADGVSIIYSAKKNDIWSIYRNTDVLIRDSGYETKTSVTNDYFFFDTTNPKHSLYIEKEQDNKYTLRKEWKIIPWTWDDVWLDVSFGYDGKIIMSAKKQDGWYIIEI
jgi:hypothetical protein